MTEARPDQIVHQAFFGWSYDTNEHTILARSFDEPDAGRWRARLIGHVRIEPVGDMEVPRKALSYLDFEDGSVAVVRRVDFGHSSGRRNAHVLIGSAATLDVSLALGLESWDGWQDKAPQNGWMGTVTVGFLADVASQAESPLPHLARLEPALTAVLTRLLENPNGPLSIIGCPDEDRLAMVWGLRAAADDYLVRQWRCKREWSYSTYEGRHEDSIKNLPKIVFLPAKPVGGGVANRTVVDLNRPPVASESVALASQLVAGLLRGTFPPAVTARETAGADSRGEPLGGTVQEQRDFASAGSRSPANDGAPDRRTRAQGKPTGHQVRDLRDKWVAPLLAVGSVQELQAELTTLSKLNFGGRDQLRAALDVRATDAVAEFVEISARHELLLRLLHAIYGPGFGDLRQDPDARKHAARLVRNSQSEQLAMMLGAGADRQGRQEISAAAFERWVAGGDQAVPTGRMAQTLRRARRSRHLPVATVVAVLALLTVVFALGYLAAPAQQPPAASGSETAAPSSVRTPPGPNQTVPGMVRISPDANRQVFAFLKVENSYYPQAPCTNDDGTSLVWKCEKRGNPPPGKPGIQPTLVAILVSSGQVSELEAKAKDNGTVDLKPEWGQPVLVP